MTPAELSHALRTELHLAGSPIGFRYEPTRPPEAIGLAPGSRGCIVPLIYQSTRGKVVAFEANAHGHPCAGFYLGFRPTIFDGIELYLSHGPLPGRECERFMQTPEMTAQHLANARPEPESGVAVFRPLELHAPERPPEVVIIIDDADRMSALTYLAHFRHPTADDRIVARFSSACAAMATFPLRDARAGRARATWGLHDISARARLPADLMSMAFPWAMISEMGEDLAQSFVQTSQWKRVAGRARSQGAA